MFSKFNFIGFDFFNFSLKDSLEVIGDIVKKDGKHQTFFSSNAYIIVKANRDPEFKKLCESIDILTVDSWVVYYAIKMLGISVKEPVSVSRILFEFLKQPVNTKYRLYFLGAEEAVLEKAISNINKWYPYINIVGYHNGYFDIYNCEHIIEDINSKKPDILLVGMSSPLKESFIYLHKSNLNIPLSIMVGGAIDIIGESKKLAPVLMSKLGLEWFYRFMQEPKRMWKRYLISNNAFVILLIREIFRKTIKKINTGFILKNNNQIKKEKKELKTKSNTGIVSVDIKNILKILGRRKWWFIITFIIAFCAIFSFTYYMIPESKYSIKSTMLIATDNIKYQEKINYCFPKEAYDLWLIASEVYPLNSLNYYYMDADGYINSNKVIDTAYEKLGRLLNKDILKKSIITSKSLDGTQLNISISYKNKNDTKKIADAILGSFTENKKNDFEAAYNDLLKKNDDKINNLNSEAASLLSQVDEYSLEFNKKIVNEAKNINNNQINFYVSDYIPPDIKVKLDAGNEQLIILKDIKGNLNEYKNLYINRIVLNTNNEIIVNINILKNIILSLAGGVIFGLIFAFAVNYFKPD